MTHTGIRTDMYTDIPQNPRLHPRPHFQNFKVIKILKTKSVPSDGSGLYPVPAEPELITGGGTGSEASSAETARKIRSGFIRIPFGNTHGKPELTGYSFTPVINTSDSDHLFS